MLERCQQSSERHVVPELSTDGAWARCQTSALHGLHLVAVPVVQLEAARSSR